MILEQYYLGCLSQASYLIGDEQTGTAVVVDPRRDVDEYIEDAAKHGLTIRHVILTHFHADFVAGHLELRQRTGARVHLGAGAKAEYEFGPLADGDVLEFGQVRLRVLATPGHTPESISILVYDLAADPGRPRAVLTGDTLFIGDVGRPDLMASSGVTANDLAGQLYDSIRQKLLPLPDDTLVYPGHGAGSACGKNLSTDTVSTVGAQRQTNYALQPMSKAKFIELVTADQPEAPAYFSRDAEINRREHELLDRALAAELRPLSLEAVLAAQDNGAQVLDSRDPVEFAGGHLPGSVNIGLGGKFATWAGTLLALDRPLVIVASPGREREAAVRLGRVGFDRIAGFLDGGIEAVRGRVALRRHPGRATPAQLQHELLPAGVPVIDVRSPAEHRQEAIPGTTNIPLHQLRERLGEFPQHGRIVVYCRTGERSSTAASLLEQTGRTDVIDVVGGITAWKKMIADEAARPR
jgi:glyoxylase-like metal-dependent hydrolase (beta-lactamase superfamily II)/rhodanese-related sulfurtransferase